MGNNTNPLVQFNCDNCGETSFDKPSHYKRKNRHFCSIKCYAEYRKEKMQKNEQNRFGTGFDEKEVEKRRKARGILNHHLRDKKIKRPNCELCDEKAEAHHNDYDKPLDVKWLCFKHHRLYHKIGNKIYENPELLNKKQKDPRLN